MKLYKTVMEQGCAEQIIEKSRFIAYAAPVKTKEEADNFIAEIRKKHKDATHNVPAMVLGDKFQIQWASDDGEPQGTSGAPMVQMLVSEEITDVVVVVTRYFGGIKLGTGGLVRAYTSGAKLALEKAGLCYVEEQEVLEYRIDYSHLSGVQNLAGKGLFQLLDTEYGEAVKITLAAQPEDIDGVMTAMADLTAGKAIVEDRRKEIVKVPVG